MSTHPDKVQLLNDVENHGLICGNAEVFKNESDFCIDDMEMFLSTFSYKNRDSSEFFDTIERAMLATGGDYAPFVSSRWLYGGRNWENWRDEVFANANRQKNLHSQLHEMLVAVKDCKTKDDFESVIDTKLSEMASNGQFTWAYYMAKYKGMRHTESARYADLGNNDSCNYNRQMMNRSQFNGKNWNPYLFCIQKKLGDAVAELGEYYASLILPSLRWVVKAEEHSFLITIPDCPVKTYEIEKTEENLDVRDRIEWFSDILSAEIKKRQD